MYTLDYYKELFCLEEEAKENNCVKEEKYLQRNVSYPRKRHICSESKANILSQDKKKIPRAGTKLDSLVTVYPTIEHSYHISSQVTESSKEAYENKKNSSKRSCVDRKQNVTLGKGTVRKKKEPIFEHQNTYAAYDYHFVCNRLWQQEELPSLVTPVQCTKSQKPLASSPVGLTTVEATPCSSFSNTRKHGWRGKHNRYDEPCRNILSSVRRNILDSFVSDDSDDKNYVVSSKLVKSSGRKKSLNKSQYYEKGKNQRSEKSVGKLISKKSIKTNSSLKKEPATPVLGAFHSPGNGSSVYHYHPITPPRFNQKNSLIKTRHNKSLARRCLNSSLEDCASKSQRNIAITPEKDEKKTTSSCVSVGPVEKQVSNVLSSWLCRKHLKNSSTKKKMRDKTEGIRSVKSHNSLEFEGYQLLYKRVKKHSKFNPLSDNQDDIAVSELISQKCNNLEEDQRATISSVAAAQIQTGNSPDPLVTGRYLNDLPVSLKLNTDETELSSALIHVSQNSHDKFNQVMEGERNCSNPSLRKTSGDEKDLDISPFYMGLSPCLWDRSWLQTTFSVSSISSCSDVCSSITKLEKENNTYTNVKDHYSSKIMCAPFKHGLSPVSKNPSYLTSVFNIKNSISDGEETTWCDPDCKNSSTMCFKHNQTFSPSEILYSVSDYSSSSSNLHFQNDILDICCGSQMRSTNFQGNKNQHKEERVGIKTNNSGNSCSCLGLLQKCQSALNHQEFPTPLETCAKFTVEEQRSEDVSLFSSNIEQNQEEKNKSMVKTKEDNDLSLTPSPVGHLNSSFMTLPYQFSPNPSYPGIISHLSVESSVLKEESSPCICPNGSQCESQRSTFYTRDADPTLTSANFTIQLVKVTALKEMKKNKQEIEPEQLSYSEADITSSLQYDDGFHDDYRSTDTSDETFWSPSQEFTPRELFTNHMTSLIFTTHSFSEEDIG